jgi:hypothetical protein
MRTVASFVNHLRRARRGALRIVGAAALLVNRPGQ